MTLTYQKVARILTIIDSAREEDLDLSLGGLRIAVTSWRQDVQVPPSSVAPGQVEATSAGNAGVLPQSLHEIRTRQLGYFRTTPGVQVGERVGKGDVIGTVSGPGGSMQAVEAPLEGRIVDLCLADGDFVEYAQILAMLDTTKDEGVDGDGVGT